jgi:L,D-transpeptidase-like protein
VLTSAGPRTALACAVFLAAACSGVAVAAVGHSAPPPRALSILSRIPKPSVPIDRRAVTPIPKRSVRIHRRAVTRWAYVLRPVAARTAPAAAARHITVVPPFTPEGANNLVLVLGQTRDHGWVRIRLAILPNGSTGWVRRTALGEYHVIQTRLVLNRARLTLTLYRSGRAVLQTRVGIGRPVWPTPPGRFYVRERLAGFGDPFYGPIAFGTSARSQALTDWPGGGFIGIHGTNQPQLIPGRISHGCIRVPNANILRLARLLPLGTPLKVS